MLSFAEKVAKSKGAAEVFLVTGGSDNSGRKAWYFIRVDSPKVSAFHRAIKSGNINLDEYGEILDSGYGEQPPESVKQFMRDKYGFNG